MTPPRLSPQYMTKHKCDFWQMTHPNEEWPTVCPHNTWQNINVIFDKWHSIIRSDTLVCPHNTWQNINVMFDKWHTNLCMFSNVGHVPKDIMTLVVAKITFIRTNIVYIESRTNSGYILWHNVNGCLNQPSTPQNELRPLLCTMIYPHNARLNIKDITALVLV